MFGYSLFEKWSTQDGKSSRADDTIKSYVILHSSIPQAQVPLEIIMTGYEDSFYNNLIKCGRIKIFEALPRGHITTLSKYSSQKGQAYVLELPYSKKEVEDLLARGQFSLGRCCVSYFDVKDYTMALLSGQQFEKFSNDIRKINFAYTPSDLAREGYSLPYIS